MIGKRTKIFAALTAAVKPIAFIVNFYAKSEIVPDAIQNAVLGIFAAVAAYFLADKVDRAGGAK